MLAASLRQTASRVASFSAHRIIPRNHRILVVPHQPSFSLPRYIHQTLPTTQEENGELNALEEDPENFIDFDQLDDADKQYYQDLMEIIAINEEQEKAENNKETAAFTTTEEQTDYASLAIPSLDARNRSNLPSLMNIPPEQDPLLQFMASRLMKHGERAKASRSISQMLLHIHAWTRAPPLPIVRQAIFKLSPMVDCLNHKHSTKMILKPVPLSEKQGTWYAVTWLLDVVGKTRQGGSTVAERLAREIILVIKGESSTLQKKELMHRTAMMNRGNISIRRT